MRIDRLALVVDAYVLLSFIGASWTGDGALFVAGLLGLLVVLGLPGLSHVAIAPPSRAAWIRLAVALPVLAIAYRLLTLGRSDGGSVSIEGGGAAVAFLIVALLLALTVGVWARIWRIFPLVPPRWKTFTYIGCLEVFVLSLIGFLPASLATGPADVEGGWVLVAWSHTIMALSLCVAAALPYVDTSFQRLPPNWSRASR